MSHIHILHSPDYYFSLLTTLIRCLQAGKTDRETAELLNSNAILSPSGKPFSQNAVTQALKKLRNHKEYPSKLHKALLLLCFEGRLNAADTLILFEPRRQPGAM